jgi:long-chain-fatty-acid--CoA ligase ACSBG
MAMGTDDQDIQGRIDAQKPGHCATLIYTSGTTGPPKAVMCSHDNITWTGRRVKDWIKFAPGDRIVSFLPLSHIAAQMLDIHGPIQFAGSVHFADPKALKGSLATTLKRVQPSIFFGVPRVWEKIAEKIKAAGKQSKGLKKKIAMWAKNKGALMAKAKQYKSKSPRPGCYGCANKLVFSKVKGMLGLNKVKACFTGAAPIGRDVLDLFAALDVPILELFGQSESSGPATTNTPELWKIGTIGVPLDGTHMYIEPETKEIVYTGRHIFMGYLKMPEKTKETIDDRGYLHSGDQGHIDEDNFVRITGRIKELIITAGGENIPPVLIEDEIKVDAQALSNVMVIGDKQKFLTAIYTLKQKMTEEGAPDPSGELEGDAVALMKECGSDAKTVAEARECDKVKAALQTALDAANSRATSRAQKIQKFQILPEDFSVPGGELGPTLKLKRPVVAEKYGDVIRGLYGADWKE